MSQDITHEEALKLFKNYFEQDKMVAKRIKHQLLFFNPEKRKVVMYDLKKKGMYRWHKDGYWKEVETQYDFFRHYSLRGLIIEEKKFRELLIKVNILNPQCTSMSSFVARLEDALVYEEYIYEGIRTQAQGKGYWRSKIVLHHYLHEYSKIIIKAFKQFDVYVNRKFEKMYFSESNYNDENINKIQKLVEDASSILLNMEDVSNTERKNFFESIIANVYGMKKVSSLVYEFNYSLKSLIGYLIKYLKPFENLDYTTALELLHDYYSMSNKMSRKVKKYPKYLHSMHDIITANYNVFKQEHDEELFYKNQKFELEWSNKDFVILAPKESKDVITEGTSLNHCVASYVNKIIEGQCLIVFLRKKGEEEKSLVTVEVINDKIVQARGAYNRDLTKEEKDALNKWANEKKLEVEIWS